MQPTWPNLTSPLDLANWPASTARQEALDVLLWLGAAMLRSGSTASRTHEAMRLMAHRMGFDAVSLSLTADTVIASVRRDGERVTGMREVGPQGINAWRIGELEQFVKAAGPDVSPRELANKLAEIESKPPRYPELTIALALAAASAGFAFLNGGPPLEMAGAAVGGGVGHLCRSWLSRQGVSPYGVVAASAAAASGVYVLVAAAAGYAGLGLTRHPAGFISSVLFLVPGFPLIAGLFDLLRHQTVAAVSRFAYGAMLLLAVTFGLGIVIAVTGVDLARQPPLELAYPLKLLLRGAASFVAGCAFAMLYSSAPRLVLAIGLLALGANELRLLLTDAGMMLAPATFFGALAIGLVALLVDQRWGVPRIVMAVPAIIIMVPGVYAFEMIIAFYRGNVIEAIQASASCAFVIGALAMGLAAARLGVRLTRS